MPGWPVVLQSNAVEHLPCPTACTLLTLKGCALKPVLLMSTSCVCLSCAGMQDLEQIRRNLIARGFVLICDYLLADAQLTNKLPARLYNRVIFKFSLSQPEALHVLNATPDGRLLQLLLRDKEEPGDSLQQHSTLAAWVPSCPSHMHPGAGAAEGTLDALGPRHAFCISSICARCKPMVHHADARRN